MEEDRKEAPLVLVVDDDPDTVALTSEWLRAADFRVVTFDDAETFLGSLDAHAPDAVCLDIHLPGLNGIDALAALRRTHPQVPVIMVSADDEISSVVQAMQRGAMDYLPKPLDELRVLTAVHNAVERFRASLSTPELTRANQTGNFCGIIGRSGVMREVFRLLERAAASDINVLVHGESGTGKELAARAIHERSTRSKGPFVALNCAAMPEGLVDSEFFGHEKGAFTGAFAQRTGRFEMADSGTLFLDEVAELSPPAQAKLLRVLEQRSFERVGGAKTIRSDFRLVCASHRSLRERVDLGLFREDLFFRLAVFEVTLPPLRTRSGDLELLVPALLSRITARRGAGPLGVSSEAMTLLSHYPFRGNIRELSNILERASAVCDSSTIEAADLPPAVRGADVSHVSLAPARESAHRQESSSALKLDDLERQAIEQAITRAGGNLAQVVRELGIGKTTLYRKLKKYGLRK